MTGSHENGCCLLYCTTSNQQEAQKIGQILVEEQLAACVNILPGMLSIYRWEGKIEQANEAVLIVKTTHNIVETTIKRIVHLHSYDCPAVLQLAIESGHAGFLDWMKNQVRIDPPV